MTENSETKEKPEPVQRVSSNSFAIIFITIALSLVALVIAVVFYQDNPDLEKNLYASVFLIIGFIGLASSTYMLMQTRRRAMSVSLEIPAVRTTITCQKCGFKNVREFERGDYVFKQAGPCPKCNNTLLISAIYREVKEKPKKDIF